MNRSLFFLLVAMMWAIVSCVGNLRAQDNSVGTDVGESTHFDLDGLNWMVGYWVGEGFGGVCEEFWSPPVAGSMLGTFKMSDRNQQVTFFEVFTLTLDSAGLPQIKLKHFNADMTGWEEKDEMSTFRYESDGTNEITIGAVRYRSLPPDSLHIDVVLKNESGEVNTETIRLRRRPL